MVEEKPSSAKATEGRKEESKPEKVGPKEAPKPEEVKKEETPNPETIGKQETPKVEKKEVGKVEVKEEKPASLPDKAPSGAKAGLPDEAPSGAKAGAKASASVKTTADKPAGEEPASAEATAGKGKPKKLSDKEFKELEKKYKDVIEKIEKMTVLELSELVKVLEDKFGVSAQAPVQIQAASGTQAPGGGEAEEEKAEFNIELTEVGPNKIQVIKVVREITEKGLKESKDLVDAAPKIVKESVPKKDAEEMKKKFEEAGAKVTLK